MKQTLIKKQKIVDVFEHKINFSIEESDSSVDGVNVLAKIKGTFFCPDSVSRNKRFYSKELWEKTLSRPEIQEQLQLKNMFGAIGHNTEINEETISEGKISHIMTKAFINENNEGEGEALILNTPSGQILNTLLRAGCTLYVSSRGEGTFNGNERGVPKVDENEYNLLGWDFVLKPGFLKANPKIAESLKELEINIDENEGEIFMSDTNQKLVENLISENTELKIKLKETLEETKKVKEFSEKLEVSEGEYNALSVKFNEAEERIAELTELNNKFLAIGETPESVEEALKSSLALSEELAEIGTTKDIKEALVKSLSFKEEVDEIGTLPEIKKALAVAQKVLKESEEKVRADRISAIASEYGVSEEVIAEMVDKGMDDESIKAMYASVAESLKVGKFKKTSTNESFEAGEEDEEDKEKEKSESVKPKASNAKKLMEHFSR